MNSEERPFRLTRSISAFICTLVAQLGLPGPSSAQAVAVQIEPDTIIDLWPGTAPGAPIPLPKEEIVFRNNPLNLIAFTTGRGSVFGSKPSPCLKLASNQALARHMDEDMDIDCSPILSGESIEAAGARIFEALIETASGKPTRSEALGLGDEEFVPWQIGAYL